MDNYRDFTINNSFNLPCRVINYYKIERLADLSKILLKGSDLPITVIGDATNVILPEKWQCLCLDINLKGIDVQPAKGNTYKLRVAAGENWHKLVKYCVDNSIHGLENLALIPGRVGAAPIQNIGAYGVELKDFLLSVEVIEIETATQYEISAEECSLSYRTSKFKREWRDKFIISHINLLLSGDTNIKTDYERLKDKSLRSPKDVFEAVVAIRSSLLPDPKVNGNVGSFFHNPIACKEHIDEVQKSYPEIKAFLIKDDKYRVAAGSLLEALGFKGYSNDGVAMSEQHSLCMINLGSASQQNVIAMAEDIQTQVKEKTGILLEIEPRVYR